MADVASVYARGLFQVARDARILDEVGQDLKEFLNLCLASTDLRKSLFSTVLDGATRQALAEEIAKRIKGQDVSVRFLGLLARKRRLANLEEIVETYKRLVDQDSGLVRGEVRSAVGFSAAEIQELANAIGKKLGSDVELSTSIDPSLLGGFIANVGGKTFDSSLRTQLYRMKEICTI